MSYSSLLYHIILRTYRSQRTLNEKYERELYQFIYGFMVKRGAKVYRIGGMPDHIHILLTLSPAIAISDFIKELKRCSSRYMKEERSKFPAFEGWSKSFAVFSYSPRDKEMIRHYIVNQKEHHKKFSFEDELRMLFQEAEVSIQEEYFLKDD